MISNEQLAALDELAKEATPGPWKKHSDGAVSANGVLLAGCGIVPEYMKNAAYIATANPAVIRAMIAELREYRHLCAQVRAVYESDSGFGEGMVISCHRESQRKDTQAVAAMLIWQQPADESADLRIGIRADMT